MTYPELVATSTRSFRSCDPPKITQEFSHQTWLRQPAKPAPYTYPEKLVLEFWLPVKEAPSGGWTVNLRMVYYSPEGEGFVTKAKAEGYGYCKRSSAFHRAWKDMFGNMAGAPNLDGTGMEQVAKFLRSLGFEKV